jgi:putative endonuclease
MKLLRKERSAPHLTIGKEGEQIAAMHLLFRGYRILGRNVRTHGGEIDIIARRFGVVVFVEVKARSSADGFDPSGRVDHLKVRRLKRAASIWLDRYGKETRARLDVIGVCEGKVMAHWEDVGS